jgi:Amt family ammonium transporter
MNNQTTIIDVSNSVDSLWISVSTYLVFFMQAGFAFLEAGTVREKSVQNILIKNMLDICACTIAWWLIGYGFAYGESWYGLIGYSKFVGYNFEGTTEYRDWMFQWAFAGTAATIVSGSLAERTQLLAYVFFSIFMTAFIYPVVVHLTWGGGILSGMGYLDFAGSGIVHLVGGTAGHIGSTIIGPRLNRYSYIDDNRHELFKPHNVPMVVLGTLILWFGWYGFNCGSALGATGENEELISLIGMNTTLGASMGGLVCFIYNALTSKNKRNRYNVTPLTNGILAGLVAITAGCNNVEPWAATLIGGIGGLIYIRTSEFNNYVHLDDPLDAHPIHGASGFWGIFAVGLFDRSKGFLYGHGVRQIAVQFSSGLIIILWTFITSWCVFKFLHENDMLRITREEELEGIDRVEHGGVAYHIGENREIEVMSENVVNNNEDNSKEEDNNIENNNEDNINTEEITISDSNNNINNEDKDINNNIINKKVIPVEEERIPNEVK